MFVRDVPGATGPDEPLVAFYVQEGSEFTFAADAVLSDFERRVAAWACAIRIERGDDVFGYTRNGLREIVAMVELDAAKASTDPERFFDVHAFGAE